MGNQNQGRSREISEGLLRQRRNLLGISLLLPLLFLSGAEIEQLNFLGTIVTIKNPDIVYFGLTGAFMYFIWRYWQYYREEKYVGEMYLVFKEHLYRSEKNYLTKVAKDICPIEILNEMTVISSNPKHKSIFGGNSDIEYKIDEKVNFLKKRTNLYVLYAPYLNPMNPEEFASDVARNLLMDEHGWERLKGRRDNYKKTFVYSWARFLLYKIEGVFRFLLNESYVTDYLLPWLLALVCGLITGYHLAFVL